MEAIWVNAVAIIIWLLLFLYFAAALIVAVVGQKEGEDECIIDTPENRAELARQATEEPTQPLTEEEPTTVPQFSMQDLDPGRLGLQQDDRDIVEEDQITEDSGDIGGTDTGSSEGIDIGSGEEDIDISNGDDGENSVSSDGDDNGGNDDVSL
jgi:hypothetical protein